MPSVTRPLSRQEAKLVTRHRLLQAARSVLLAQGPEGLTTGGVTRLVGVAQPTFYVHFRDMDALLQALAQDMADTLRKAMHDAWAPMRGALDVTVASNEAMSLSIKSIAMHADWLRLFLAEQHRTQSTLGIGARQLLAALRNELAADLAGWPIATGLRAAQLNLVAEAVLGLMLQFGLALADKRDTDEVGMVQVLTHTMSALLISMPRP